MNWKAQLVRKHWKQSSESKRDVTEINEWQRLPDKDERTYAS